jgi:hypothetical protein
LGIIPPSREPALRMCAQARDLRAVREINRGEVKPWLDFHGRPALYASAV